MLAGTRPVGDLVRAAAAAGMPAIALTDTDGMYAVVPFERACAEAGIRAIRGVELTGDVGRVTLLARTRDGYSELCRLVTRRRLDGDFSLAAALEHISENVYALTDDPRALAQLEGRSNAFAALPVAIGHEWTEKRWRLRREAARLGLRTVAAGDVFFLDPREHFVHRVLTAIRTRTTVGTLPPGAAAPPSAFFHSPADVARAFHDDPASIEAALEIAEGCRFDLNLHSLKLPRFALAGGEEPFATLRRLALRGLKERLGERGCDAAAQATLDRELDVVRAKGLADYFLISLGHRAVRAEPRDALGGARLGREQPHLVRPEDHAREPDQHNMFFERFLNPEREQPSRLRHRFRDRRPRGGAGLHLPPLRRGAASR